MQKEYVRVLTIAGSDSGGGAGIQADLKTFSALGCYGMSVITAVTAQNTLGVTAVHELPPSIVSDQLDAVLQDIGVDAVKIGMLSSPDIIRVVGDKLRHYGVRKVVIDPVMAAKSGDKLLRDEAVNVLKGELLPLALLLTPNIPEAEILTGMSISERNDLQKAAERLLECGPKAVLVKGGHMRDGNCDDFLLDASTGYPQRHWFRRRRIESKNTH